MMKLCKLPLNYVFVFLAFCLVFSSCCNEEDYSLSDLRVCDQRNSDLGSPPECPSDMSILDSNISWITASVHVHNSDPQTMIHFRLINVTGGADQELQSESYTLGSIDSEFEGDECDIVLTQSWPVTGELPDADLEIRVELDGEQDDFLSRSFRVRN